MAPTCSPTRAALVTGHWANRTGVWHTVLGRSLLREDEVTMGQIFLDAGYATGMFGKWYLGDNYPFRPEDRGFSEVMRHGGGTVGETSDFWDNAYFDDTYFHNSVPEPVEGYCTDVWFDYARRFIAAQKKAGKPFLAYISTNAPHWPMHSPPVFAAPHEERLGVRVGHFLGMIANIDDNVGRMQTFLEQEGLAKKTIFIFTTDNGTKCGDKVFNAGMRGRKTSEYDGGHRVPLFIHWPAGGLVGGRDVEPITALVDVLPTLIDLCGIAPPEGVKFDGRSICPLLKGKASPADGSWPDRILVTDSQRFEYPIPWNKTAVMTSRWRLVNGEELYNIKQDPGQENNVADAHPEEVTRLTAFYEAWWAELEPTFQEAPAKEAVGETDMAQLQELTPKPLGINAVTLAHGLVLAAVLLSGPVAANEPAEIPVVRWTAGDAPDFRYQFLENVKTAKLLHATPETGTFNHHGYLAHYQGVLFACWDSQARDENTSGQHGMFCYSTDDGKTWSDPKPLFPPLAQNVPASETKELRPFQTSQGFIEIEGQLYAVEIVDKSLKQKVYRYNEVSRERIGWLARQVRTDGTLGDAFWLSAVTPEPEPGFPAYPAGDPSLVAKINAHFKEPANLPQLVFGPRAHPDSDDEHRMTEPTPSWQLGSGTWVRLYRDVGSIHAKSKREVEASKSRRNYSAFSFDDGRTWTTPTRTSFPDSCARSNAGRLPDGQYYVINNVLPMSPKKGGRSLLAISLSRDGLTFDRSAVLRFVAPQQRHEGKAKSIGYQYPHSVVVGKALWVIYSVNKEDIEVARIPLSEIYSLK